MKITSVKRVVTIEYFVDTDEDLFPHFIRQEDGSWARIMGESIETCFITGWIEPLFQEWVKTHGDRKYPGAVILAGSDKWMCPRCKHYNPEFKDGLFVSICEECGLSIFDQ